MLSQIVEDQDYRNLRNVLPSYIPPNLYPRSAFETRIKSYEGQRYDAQFKLVNKKRISFLKKSWFDEFYILCEQKHSYDVSFRRKNFSSVL